MARRLRRAVARSLRRHTVSWAVGSANGLRKASFVPRQPDRLPRSVRATPRLHLSHTELPGGWVRFLRRWTGMSGRVLPGRRRSLAR